MTQDRKQAVGARMRPGASSTIWRRTRRAPFLARARAPDDRMAFGDPGSDYATGDPPTRTTGAAPSGPDLARGWPLPERAPSLATFPAAPWTVESIPVRPPHGSATPSHRAHRRWSGRQRMRRTS